jgi:peptidoglycan hydrolase-like protein with peptidoglycan-binding domain
MPVPSVTQGRGAWTATGKDNKSRYYEYILGKPMDGASPTRDVNYEAVNLGVKAIQARINALGYSPALVVDGYLGKASGAGIVWVQKKLGLYADGQAGPTTCKALWRDLIIWWCGYNQVPSSHVYGFMALESTFDPGAVGFVTPSDRGLCQINLVAHPTVTVEQAFDPHYAINYTADRLEQARKKYSGKGVNLQTVCSIAQHNSPVAADAWYKTGTAPNEQIARYVELVLQKAAEFNA